MRNQGEDATPLYDTHVGRRDRTQHLVELSMVAVSAKSFVRGEVVEINTPKKAPNTMLTKHEYNNSYYVWEEMVKF